MDFQILEEIKARSAELEEMKAKAKLEAIATCKQIIEAFDLISADLFIAPAPESQSGISNSESGESQTAKKVGYKYTQHNFVEGDLLVNPKDPTKVYRYVKLGKKPSWLRVALETDKLERVHLLKK